MSRYQQPDGNSVGSRGVTTDQGPEDGDGVPSQYITPEGIPTRAEVAEDLKQHVEMAHVLPLRLAESKVNQTKAESE